MKNKSNQELTDIAKKAWVTRLKNKKKFKFKNTDGINKIAYRKLKADFYQESKLRAGNVLLLPSQTCADVYEINKCIPFNSYTYIGAEINNMLLRILKIK